MTDDVSHLLGDKPLGWYDFKNYSYCNLCGDRISSGQRWCSCHNNIWKRGATIIRRALEALPD